MGGPGSGRRPRAVEAVADLGDLTRMGRGPLEAMYQRALSIGATAEADAIRAELATRTFQHTNPYAPVP